MTIKESLADLRASIEALEKQLAEKAAAFGKDESASAEHRARLGEIGEKANAVKQKLPSEEGSVWDAVKHEVKRDMDALTQDFNHTVDYIDKHYREQK